MKLIGKQSLDEFKKKYNDARSQIDSWIAEVEYADWQKPMDIKRRHASASFLENNHVIFNIKGNHYRLKVRVDYGRGLVLVQDIDTHKKYERW
jgi:mRNA interferase HigB